MIEMSIVFLTRLKFLYTMYMCEPRPPSSFVEINAASINEENYTQKVFLCELDKNCLENAIEIYSCVSSP